MKKNMLALAVVAGLTLFAGNAKTSQITYNLNVLGADFSFAATLQASNNGDGSFTAVSGSGQFGNSGLFANDLITLTPNSNAPSVINIITPGEMDWFYDNQLYPDTTLLNYNGLSFSFSDSGTNWYLCPYLSSTGPNIYLTSVLTQNGMLLSGSSALSYGEISIITLTEPVPEPSIYALLGMGALALINAYRRKVA